MEKPILFYYGSGEFPELSNFFAASFEIGGKRWKTVEHYFQAMKSLDPDVQERIRRLVTPKEAKQVGRHIELRPDWESVKESVMLEALRAKFSQNLRLMGLLLGTAPAPLHEDSPYDMYWGRRGKDRLGILLMQVRSEMIEKA